jgi:hypothetical protein
VDSLAFSNKAFTLFLILAILQPPFIKFRFHLTLSVVSEIEPKEHQRTNVGNRSIQNQLS